MNEYDLTQTCQLCYCELRVTVHSLSELEFWLAKWNELHAHRKRITA